MKNNKNLIKLYLDTSIYGSYNNHKEGRAKIVRRLFDEIEKRRDIRVYYSMVVLEELSGAPKIANKVFENFILEKKVKQLRFNTRIEDLAHTYLREGVLTTKSYEDALHIAFSSYYNMDMLLTYNMKHMAQFLQVKKYNAINEKMGFKKLIIIPPNNILI